MKKQKNQLFFLIAIIFLVLLLISPIGIELLQARPGGGHSFSGGGGSSGGGGGDGIGYLIYFILAELPPQISIPLVIIIIGLRIYMQRRKKNANKTVSSSPGIQAKAKRNTSIESDINTLKSYDPNFSKILFLDFASSLYNKFYSLKGQSDFKNLHPFFSDSEMKNPKNTVSNQRIYEIVIGSIKIYEVNNLEYVTGIAVDIEANYTLEVNQKKTRYHVIERWYFNRNKGVLSPEPEKLRKLVCPVCAAPVHFTDNGDCESCGTHINAGEMQWYVLKKQLLSQRVFSTKGLAHYEAERGTGLQTIYQSGLNNRFADFSTKHSFDWNVWRSDFTKGVVHEYFKKIYAAWSENNLLSVRNLLTDRVYESFMFWIKAYQRAGLKNKLENISISNVQFVALDMDKFYESITVRIYASSLDYVEDSAGRVKGGSSKRARSFSEYWTFIRRTGVEKDVYDFSTCPNCGAPADKMGQAGVCEYCGTKISNGDFSWVLAVITQDEVYSG